MATPGPWNTAPAMPAEAERHRPRVLIVDDERNIRTTLGMCLESAGCDVTGVATAEAARAAVERAPFDLCFLDLKLGDDSGMDLLPQLLAALRARLKGRCAGKIGVSAPLLDELAGALKAARFGVAVWSAAELDALAIEMLCGIVNDLNAMTRFSGLPLAPSDNAIGVQQVCGWMTGFPVRTGFGRSYPDHDPWQYRAARLVDSGEADCVLWIAAYRAAAPQWRGDPPIIALAPADTKFPRLPRVHIAVGCPGRDHDSVEYHAVIGTLAAVTATHRSEALSVADAIASIATHLSAEPLSC